MSRAADFTKTALLSLLSGAAIMLVLASPGGARKLLKAAGYELRRREQRQRFFWTLAYLRRKQYIDYREEKDGTISVVLTEDGKKRALRYKFDALVLPKTAHWDRKWRILMFDIPVRFKKAREAFRYKIKDLGLAQYQKSVWIYPYPCLDEVAFTAKFFGVAKYVHFVEAESISGEIEYKEIFDLL